MIKVKVSELSGAALDWAVARAGGYAWQLERGAYGSGFHVVVKLPEPSIDRQVVLKPSSDWAQGGPLIEKYRVDLSSPPSDTSQAGWDARVDDGHLLLWANGSNALIAACRAIVAAKFGAEIEVPAELMEQSDAAS